MTRADKKNHNVLAGWVGDIAALESHIEEAMDHQLEIETPSASLKRSIQHFHDEVKASKQRAEEYQKQVGSTAGNPVIKAGSEALGKAAGMIDKLRSDTVSKALRDDYTAYNHLAIAYTMLHTTSMALNDTETMAFAEKGLRTYAGLVQELNNVIPEAVVQDLHDNGDVPNVDTSVVAEGRAVIDSIWKATS